MADSNNLAIAAFTAIGTVVGYVGAESACPSIFERQLWPSRFYNTTSWRSWLAMVFLLPSGGPIHKAAIAGLDKFAKSGLWLGYCRGDMLGTAFFEDTQQKLTVKLLAKDHHERFQDGDARNAFWIRVLALVPGMIDEPLSEEPRRQDVEASKNIQRIRARKPVMTLKLSRAADYRGSKLICVVNGDVGNIQPRHIFGIILSETVTLAFGVTMAAVWRTWVSTWFLLPLLVKLFGLLFAVRREGLKIATPGAESEETEQKTLDVVVCSVNDISRGFMVIEGPSALVEQFFRHYGHPQRFRRGLRGDRIRELLSMCTIIAGALIYPAGLLLFIYSNQAVQWVWLAYTIYCVLAMHLYRYCGGATIGTSQREVARDLAKGEAVKLTNSNGEGVIATLQTSFVGTVSEGREMVERHAAELAEHLFDLPAQTTEQGPG